VVYPIRRPTQPVRWVVAWVLGTAAIYAALFGIANHVALIAVLGIVPLALAVALLTVATLRDRALAWVHGTALVVSASPAPTTSEYGTCELVLRVEAPGLPTGVAVKVSDPHVPVAKWPDPGETLPVRVRPDGGMRVQIQWDDVAAHSEAVPWADLPEASPPELDESELEPLTESLPPVRRVLPLEDEPSFLVARYLFPTERFRGEWRRHLVRPGETYVVVLALAVAGTIAVRQRVPSEYVTESAAGICVVGGVLASYAIVAWYFSRFVLTNKRLMLVQGVLRRRVSSVALSRITDLRYQQSLSGRILNFGSFVIEGAPWLSRMRRIADLPSPNELYLRTVEELYEPRAVEARLARWADDDGQDGTTDPSPIHPEPESLAVALREALYGPALSNYDGWVSVEVADEYDQIVPLSTDRHVTLEPGRAYQLYVFIGVQPATDTAEPLVVTGGVDRAVVEFAAEVDSDRRELRRPSQPITVDDGGAIARFAIQTPDTGFTVPPWLWIRVSQHRRLLQSIELTAVSLADAEG
jgi:Bacterial PH domain